MQVETFPVIQCVPNFSEGRDQAVVEAIASAAREASHARVIDYSFDPDHNRMVLTMLGDAESIRKSMFAAASRAVELIDMRRHSGAHPRVGAVDVVPLVPIRGVTMENCVDLSREIGSDLADKLGVPAFFYECSALHSRRTNLSDVRRGGYERLRTEGLHGDLAPDLGPAEVHATAGATVVGARGPLVAYNVNLATTDIEVARAIVRKIRSGEAGLEGVKAMSVNLASRSKVQVSMNITRPEQTSLARVYSFVCGEAEEHGLEVAESEIIGAIRRKFLEGTSVEELKALDFRNAQIIDNWL